MRKPPVGTKCGSACRLRFNIQGQSFSLYTGQWQDQHSRNLATTIGISIFNDYQHGQFDQSLAKYESMKKPQQLMGYSKEVLITKLTDEISIKPTAPKANVLSKLKAYPKAITNTKQAADFYTWLKQSNKGKSLAPETLRTYLTVLNMISRDLFGNLKFPKSEQTNPVVITREQIEKVLASLDTCRYKNLIIFYLNTGVRGNEALAMTWAKVNFDEKYVTIDASLTSDRKRGPTKTRKSIRNVGLCSAAINALKAVQPSIINPDDFVFKNTDGLPISLSTLRKVFYHHLYFNNVPRVKLKDFRSTFASYMIATRQFSLIEVSNQVGNSVPVLVKHYGNIINQVQIPDLFEQPPDSP